MNARVPRFSLAQTPINSQIPLVSATDGEEQSTQELGLPRTIAFQVNRSWERGRLARNAFVIARLSVALLTRNLFLKNYSATRI